MTELQPHPNIKSLNLTHFRGKEFPSWMMRMVVEDTILENLTVVELCYCYRCEHLPTLGLLRSLEILKLEKLECVEACGKEFYRSERDTSLQVFSALKCLRIYSLHRLKNWESPPKELELGKRKLKTSVPPPAELESRKPAFPCLKTLEIKSC